MSNSIFDWDDEEEKKEAPARPQTSPPPDFSRPSVEETRDPAQWRDRWQQPVDPYGEPPQQTESQWTQEPVEHLPYEPENADENIRRGGLAWSAGIVFFSSIVFMLLVGWVVDWLFQSSPWGIVGGIVLGSVLGFVQFFRLSSQIFNPAKTEGSMKPLIGRDDEER
jgi:F0F1-type ATP synthase assembly protein I